MSQITIPHRGASSVVASRDDVKQNYVHHFQKPLLKEVHKVETNQCKRLRVELENGSKYDDVIKWCDSGALCL